MFSLSNLMIIWEITPPFQSQNPPQEEPTQQPPTPHPISMNAWKEGGEESGGEEEVVKPPLPANPIAIPRKVFILILLC